MPLKDIEQTFSEALEEDNYRGDTYGEYHPSTITGCPLKGFLDKMTESETKLNNWMFQGSAVHYYIQEKPNLLTKALEDAGYHPLDTEYEVRTIHDISEDVRLTGTCDILTHGENGTSILDIKYSSVRPETHQGRLMKYMSQVNTYAYMFGADEYGLLLLYSRANENASGNKPKSIPESVLVIPEEPDKENWEITKSKALMIHQALEEYGYDDGLRWDNEELEISDDDFWDGVMNIISSEHCPSYDRECRYCDHQDYCPVYNSGLSGMGK